MDLAPLFVVAGAPGAGKTTVRPHLVRLAHGPVVMEMDEILEDGTLLGVPIADPAAAPVWPAYDRLWSRIVRMVRRAGHPVVLLAPAPSPEALSDGSASEDLDGRVHWSLLDCAEPARRERLRARGWSTEAIDDAVAEVARVRPLLSTVFDNDAATPEECAARILTWVRGHTGDGRLD